ncbi:MAG: hypothetical protein A3J46_06375 [Candidatus Yanofskybacteria bacterium RIFCSPHIGHO2_02_FULL_41_11]|uniref:HNH nuclease domain-containing protein n=1 Tax=Candidatus Yanofskybacteria bacterium RIFCSPHIGHO2_02_FULL_41_11 TaxID=1802675 RepID=A0A1F8FD29_9BACT|nr:MAG: hypothetical protein A3J46_06375 [Candidatus Yanofskybacteria bacterium RIFCSPHIGHO2_02_FULL_41_11]
MPKCQFKDCDKYTQYKNTKHKYCLIHLARIRRHGYPEPKKNAYQPLEKLPHKFVDDFILKNCKEKFDEDIALELKKVGYNGATKWTVGFRRRKLGNRKYLRGEIQKHKAWVRAQAIKKYGNKCELCSFNGAVDTHHIIPKYQGGPHEIKNLMIVCPNCHALITRGRISLAIRNDIPKVRKRIIRKIRSLYSDL